MKLGKRILLGGFLVAVALLVVGSEGTQLAQAQDQKKGGKGGGKALPSFKSDATFKAAFHSSVAKVSKSTVRIKCDGNDTALGVVLTADGFILTKAHDLQGKITVKLPTGEELDAKWIGYHDAHDLAVLKVKAVNLIPVEFTDSTVAPVGNFVASVGTGADPVAIGVVSVAARKMPAATGKKGPVEPKTGLDFLGIKAADDPRGAKVTAVQLAAGGGAAGGKKGGGAGGKGAPGGKAPESPAKDKVKANDIIVAIGNKAIKNAETLTKELQIYKALDEVTVRLIRGDEFVEQHIRISPPPDQANAQNQMGSDLSKRFTGFPVILQHDSVVLPKDCGGALVDLDGRVIGINVCRAGRVDSHTVPSETIRPLLADLMAGKLPPPKRR